MWVSLVGLLSFQVYWISTAYSQKKEQIEAGIEEAFSKANNGLLVKKLAGMSGVDISISTNGRFFSPDSIVIGRDATEHGFEMFGQSLNYSMSINSDEDETMPNGIITEIKGALRDVGVGFGTEFFKPDHITKSDFSFMDSLLGAYLVTLDMDNAYVLTFGNTGSTEFEFSGPRHSNVFESVETRSLIQPFSLGSQNKMAKLIFPKKEVVKASLSSIGLIIVASVLMLLLFVGAWFYIVRSLQRQYQLTLMKDDFISNMTHELKTPVTASSLALEVISKNDKVKEDTQLTNLIGIAKTEQERMLCMIDTILESTTQNGVAAEDLTELYLDEELEAVIETIRMKVDELDGILDMNVAAQQLKVRASQVHLQNAMINLLENAIKYAGGTPHIKVGVRKESKMAVLQITDHGIGISKEDQKRVFEKFFRVHTGNVHTIKGYGLGLSYTKAVIESCGGEIGVSSELHKGTSFTIKLPLLYDS